MANGAKVSQRITQELDRNGGILRLEPAWVARAFLAPGRRLGLPESEYELGERGGICERWLASTTPADNPVKMEGEGLSYLALEGGERITLKQAIETVPDAILGREYAAKHSGLGRLPKMFDYAERLPYHLHQMQEHAKLVGCNSKEEAYYFPEGVPMGPSPETYFGVHPYITETKQYNVLLSHLTEWKDDNILQHSRAYKQIPGDGWHVPAGTLHAPGSALTIELQEDSDVFAMLQARVGPFSIDKELLFKDVTKEDRSTKGEKAILEMIDWEVNGDPYFYENRHTPPLLIEVTRTDGGEEYWIFYNTLSFNGKKTVIHPGGSFSSTEKGVYSILVWAGKGVFGDLPVEGQNPELDELVVAHDRAVGTTEIRNTGQEDLIIFKFFGPDINRDVPMLPRYPLNAG